MKKHNILVVDDSELNLDILVGVLSGEYHVSVATDGESLWEVITASLPDIILLDIILPDVSGYKLCEQLKKNEQTRHIPIIFVTAKDHSEDEELGLSLGAVDYITKPIVPGIVKARVKNHLDLQYAQEMLREKNKELEEMLQLREQFTQMLQEQNEELEKVLQLREELSQMIVHDVRSPIASILGACEMATLEDIEGEVAELIEDINYHAKHANSFLNDLLLLAKGSEDKLVLHQSDVDMKKVIIDCNKNYKFICQAKKIEIKCEVPDDDKFFSLDENLFKRVLDNLVANALKFSPVNNSVIIHLEYTCDGFCLQVCDYGTGIPDEQKKLIFDKFKTVEAKRSNIKQIGLGLSFCKMVVEAHQGKIYVKNNVPKGSVFVIEI